MPMYKNSFELHNVPKCNKKGCNFPYCAEHQGVVATKNDALKRMFVQIASRSFRSVFGPSKH